MESVGYYSADFCKDFHTRVL